MKWLRQHRRRISANVTPSQTRIYDVGCAVSLRHGVGWRKDEAADKMAEAMVNRFADSWNSAGWREGGAVLLLSLPPTLGSCFAFYPLPFAFTVVMGVLSDLTPALS